MEFVWVKDPENEPLLIDYDKLFPVARSFNRDQREKRCKLAQYVPALLKRQRGRCNVCRKEHEMTNSWDVDHVVPLFMGGTNDLSNFQYICVFCHRKIKTPIVDKFIKINKIKDRKQIVALCKEVYKYKLCKLKMEERLGFKIR